MIESTVEDYAKFLFMKIIDWVQVNFQNGFFSQKRIVETTNVKEKSNFTI